MWPLSNRRSSTFSMSKLGYLASRAPSAMFSKSKKTAMVASDAGLDMNYPAVLKPVVIEAYADSLGIDVVGHNLMTKPAFEQDQLAGRGGKRDPRQGLAPGLEFARRRGHETIQARILEFDSRRPRRHSHIVSPAQCGVGMQVQAVHRVPRHDIDPAIGHFEFAAVKIPFNRAAKGRDMTFELSPQRIEGGRYALQAMHRPVGGITARIVLQGPVASGRIVFAQLPAFLPQLAIEVAGIAFLQWGRVDERRK